MAKYHFPRACYIDGYFIDVGTYDKSDLPKGYVPKWAERVDGNDDIDDVEEPSEQTGLTHSELNAQRGGKSFVDAAKSGPAKVAKKGPAKRPVRRAAAD